MSRVLAHMMVLVALTTTGPRLADAAEADVSLWIAPDAGDLGEQARKALVSGLAARGRGLRALTIPERQPEPSLREALMNAIGLYRGVHFAEAMTALRELASRAQIAGGGDLRTPELYDLYLYLALASQEQGNPDGAWDAFIRAVRIDPSRALDPAQVPPRAAAAHKRAQTELLAQPLVTLELRVPTGARVTIDGDEGHGGGMLEHRLVSGPHFVRVDLAGYEPYRGTITLPSGSTAEIFAPTLRPTQLRALIGSTDHEVAILERRGEGFTLSLRAPLDGLVVEATSRVRADDAPAVVARLLGSVFGPPPVARAATRPAWKKWWVWTIVGGAAAAVAVAVPLGVLSARGSTPGSAGGALVPLR